MENKKAENPYVYPHSRQGSTISDVVKGDYNGITLKDLAAYGYSRELIGKSFDKDWGSAMNTDNIMSQSFDYAEAFLIERERRLK